MMNMLLKISGVILLMAGLILAYKPGLLSTYPLPTDPYQVIEKRVRWGFMIGLGLLLLFHHPWTPWGLTVSALLIALTTGIIIARLLGMLWDGFFAKQMLWLAVELGALLIFGFLYWKLKP
ncbi:hypothetical protein J2X69_004185 [Algoriphagus sp. 4150]|uniref:hypothetical protein n=1 Tax=Algoriphagus sp. 4150 TaxID=2817756 RepID=UPI00285F6BF9|nr:hypothetical protein [Algoriphagus sp. 4150]MDR7131820.1 hypothetical protein [Algoriphagus sp. 4150]